MGINPTPTNHRSFTFDGKSTREFGVYITGKGVFNAPERAVEMISIPGRDGEYALDQGHFNNIEVTYRAGIVADSTTDFAEAISNFRNWLASREGYCRLTDEYNTEEYRMAVFKNAIALEHEGLLTGEFDVTFDCKPQRYLAIGEELTEIGAWGNTETAEGEIVTIEASSDTAVKALTADIDPIQDLHGYDAPWVGGAGINLMGAPSINTTVNGVTFVSAGEKLSITGTASANAVPYAGTMSTAWATAVYGPYPAGTYTVKANNFTPAVSTDKIVFNATYSDDSHIEQYPNGIRIHENAITFTATQPFKCGIWISLTSGSAFNCPNVEIVLNKGTSLQTWTPYENICPISGHDDVTVTVADDVDNPTVSEDYTTTLPSTTYGGTLDVVSGLLTVTHALLDGGSKNWIYWYGHNFYTTVSGKGADSVTDIKCESFATTTGGTGQDADGVFNQVASESQLANIYIKDSTVSADSAGATALKAKLNGYKIWYRLATPQTYQLTPQQVELLLGENHIFADSGNVTVEYGHNPTLLTNPTWFPSKPLLAVEGYGSIGFNGYEIEIENVPIGDVTLASETSFFLENSTQTFSLDADKYNVGDIITVAVNQIGFDYSIDTNTAAHAHSTTATDSMSGVTSTVKADTSFWGTGCLFYGTTKPSSITFTAGTSANFVNVVSGRLTIQLETLALRNILYTLTETVSYDATQNTISFSLSSTTSYDAAEVRNAVLRNRFTPSKIDGINVFSTISAVDGTVYIDCEVGECWNVNDDVILPLNNVISLGSDLPTLPPGDTEVTYDNTITKVEVQPNYWKV